MPYILDTNIFIHLIQRQPPQVLQRLSGLTQGEALVLVVTYAELRAGLDISFLSERAMTMTAIPSCLNVSMASERAFASSRVWTDGADCFRR